MHLLLPLLLSPALALAQPPAPNADVTEWTQSSGHIEHHCQPGERLALNGTDNTVVLTGDCRELTVVGAGNHIRAERIAQVDITGADTEVIWSGVQKTPPRTQVVGAGSRVIKARPSR